MCKRIFSFPITTCRYRHEELFECSALNWTGSNGGMGSGAGGGLGSGSGDGYGPGSGGNTGGGLDRIGGRVSAPVPLNGLKPSFPMKRAGPSIRAFA